MPYFTDREIEIYQCAVSFAYCSNTYFVWYHNSPIPNYFRIRTKYKPWLLMYSFLALETRIKYLPVPATRSTSFCLCSLISLCGWLATPLCYARYTEKCQVHSWHPMFIWDLAAIDLIESLVYPPASKRDCRLVCTRQILMPDTFIHTCNYVYMYACMCTCQLLNYLQHSVP